MSFLFGLVQTITLLPAVISSVSLFNSACFHHDAPTTDWVSHRWSVCHTVFSATCFLQASYNLQSVLLLAFVVKLLCSLIQLWLIQRSACRCSLTCFVSFWVAAGRTRGKKMTTFKLSLKLCRVMGSAWLDHLTLVQQRWLSTQLKHKAFNKSC